MRSGYLRETTGPFVYLGSQSLMQPISENMLPLRAEFKALHRRSSAFVE